jgi:hypothetical protein
MIEIFFIFFQILFIGLLTLYSIPSSITQPNFTDTLLNVITINLLIFLNILLLYSFLSINIIYLLFILIISSIFFFINHNKKKYLNFKIEYLLIYFYIFGISIAIANQLEFGWDAKFFWFLKTINFYQNNNIFNLGNLPATDYPHLGSYVWSFFWKFPFNSFEYHGRIFYVFFYVISIFYFCEIFKNNKLNKFIFGSLIILITYNYELFSGNQEILIFSLVLLSSKLVFQILNREIENKKFAIILLLLSFNSSLWIKNEGIFLVGFMLFLLFILGNLNLSEKLLIFFGFILLIVIKLTIFNFQNTSLESFEFEKTLNSNFFKYLLINLKTIIFYFTVYALSLPIILLGLILIIFNLYFFEVDRIQVFIISYSLLSIFFIFTAFLLSMENVEWQVRVGLKRVMFESSSFFLLACVYSFNKLQKT